MAAAFVSLLLDKLFSIGFERAEEEVRGVLGVEEEVEKLTSHLQAIQAVLEDADRRQVKDAAVEQWLDKLGDVSYDIDDVLDRWNTERLKMQIEGDENASGQKRKVSSINPFSWFSFRQDVPHRDIVVKIKHLNGRLDDIASEKSNFNFTSTRGVEEIERQMTASVVDESEVRGRDKEKKTIVDKLLSESSQGPTFRTISIIGTGGLGKTTLAQLVYNDETVKAHFQKRIWVCVSDPFDEIRIAKVILEALEDRDPNLNQLESLLSRIHQSIEGKKFLLILDDVWTEDYEKWGKLKNCFTRCSSGSKILVTTRNEKVANVMGTTKPDMFSLEILSKEDCRSLFSLYAFSERTSDEREELEGIGWEIVDRCKGLPLAVKTLGNLLRSKKTRARWLSVKDSELWELEDVERGLFPPLLLSYYDLSPRMRRCFSYCAIFPKDHPLKKNELIYLWMAQGYLKETKNEPVEMNGEECFESLAMRSFFQDFERDKDGSIIGCKMHDIVHDFAQSLIKNECLVMEVNSNPEASMTESSYEKTRHLRMTLEEGVSIPIFIYKLKNLRSLTLEYGGSPSNDLGLPKLFDELTCLRALEFRWGVRLLGGIKEIPKEIGKLIHLRYLKLGRTDELQAFRNDELRALPETVCELCNLQVLDVSWCCRLERLPHGLGKLINLRHLEIWNASIEYMPKGIERLTSLCTLDKFVVSDGDNDGEAVALGALKNLKHLRGRLRIERLGKVRDVDEVKKAQFHNKEHLIELFLDFGWEESEGRMKNDEQVIEAIQPPPNLEKLTIWSYRGRSLYPNWMASLTNLKKVEISFSSNCEVLPPLGKLSSLESLQIWCMYGVKRVGNELLGIESEVNKNEGPSNTSSSLIAFPKLKDLTFGSMHNWKEWEDYGMRRRMGEEEDITTATTNITIMPRLHSLTITRCPKLKALPHHLLHKCPSLKELQIWDCPILSERYHNGRRKGEEWANISHIPNIIINDIEVQRDGMQPQDSESPDYTAQAPPEHSDSESTDYNAPPEDSDSESTDYTAPPEDSDSESPDYTAPEH